MKENADGDTEEVWCRRDVVYDLGAASVLWDRKIIILREEG
ncbi:MAG: hypothetical protein U5K38_14320 [Woeseiaceae bacterium]|nr:hypothetical protein [Woeseiaceae bacterium]